MKLTHYFPIHAVTFRGCVQGREQPYGSLGWNTATDLSIFKGRLFGIFQKPDPFSTQTLSKPQIISHLENLSHVTVCNGVKQPVIASHMLFWLSLPSCLHYFGTLSARHRPPWACAAYQTYKGLWHWERPSRGPRLQLHPFHDFRALALRVNNEVRLWSDEDAISMMGIAALFRKQCQYLIKQTAILDSSQSSFPSYPRMMPLWESPLHSLTRVHINQQERWHKRVSFLFIFHWKD